MDWDRMRGVATRWDRPYTSMQRAWVDALGVPPSGRWGAGTATDRAPDRRYRGARELMRQRYGVQL